MFTNLWGLQNTGQSVNGFTGTAGDDIRFVAAWGLARPTTNQVVVAVIDTGVDYTHPDLAGNMWTNSGEIPGNGVDDDGNGYVDDYYGYDFADNLPNPTDSGFHGTHVAGTIAAVGNNQLGVIGVDYQAKIMALRASSDGEMLPDSAIIEAIQYATMMKERGVNIVAINESFGGGGSNSTERAAMQAAGNAGIIFCVAAGNSTNNNDTTPVYPASYRLTNMIVVAATDQNDALAGFSNYGTNTVDLGAPGVNILSALPVSQAGTLAYVQQGSTTYAANELTYSGVTTGITATVYDCGLGYPTDFPTAVSNNIALIARGTLYFSNKVANAMAAGARAAVIYNNAPTAIFRHIANQQQLDSRHFPFPGGRTCVASASPRHRHRRQRPRSHPDLSISRRHLDGDAACVRRGRFRRDEFSRRNRDPAHPARPRRTWMSSSGLNGKVRTGGRLNLQRIVDTDTNGLPDWWELQYFGHLTGTDPNADADHDGMSNLAEWLAGTNPTNASSCLRLIAIPSNNPNAFVVKWPSVAGKYYWLERSTNLLTGFNSVVQTNIAATAPTNTATDTAILPGKARFYRVGVEQ